MILVCAEMVGKRWKSACLFTVYCQILENNGSNQYDMPHEGSRKRQRDGSDVCDLTVTRGLVRSRRVVVGE